MKSVLVKAFGSVDQLEVAETARPVPGPDQFVLRVKACGLNFADVLQRQGLYVGGPKPPYVPGLEASGVVEAVSPEVEVRGVRVGMRVVAIAAGRLHAELAAPNVAHCIRIPDSLSFEEAAGFPVQYLTAYHALFSIAKAVSGETVLIHAAAGGLGTAAVQIARLAGLRVAATASTEEKRNGVHRLGADVVSTYESFVPDVRKFTDGKGPDIIVETIGGDIFRKSLLLLRPMGRLVLVGMSEASPKGLEPAKLLYGSKAVMGFHLNVLFDHPALLEKSLDELVHWLKEGKLKVQIGHTFPLSNIREAHRLMESREHLGKIVLVP